MKKIYLATTVLLFGLSTSLMANNPAKEFFIKKEYKKAFPLLKTQAENGSKSAMYRLAYMYQNGLGVEQDYKEAAKLYQQAASYYNYTVDSKQTMDMQDRSITQRLSAQISPAVNKQAKTDRIDKITKSTPETTSYANYLSDYNFFGLEAYDSNYILPISYSKHKYNRVSASTHENNYTLLQREYESYDSNSEVEFQISLKKALTYDLFGFDETINVAYTQKVWWQLYSDSAPFRETNYLPEIFVSIPTSESIDAEYGLKAVDVGFVHESNGQEGYRSRSWNRVYTTAKWQWDNLFLASRVWYRIPESEKHDGYYDGEVNPSSGEYDPNDSGDDNPDIDRYLGYGDLKLNYLYGKSEMGALLRYNFGSGGKNRGAVDLHWTYPFLNSKSTFWYVKFFNGYGESLIDYNHCVTKTSFGFSFSRGDF
jgi:phospholipase A1